MFGSNKRDYDAIAYQLTECERALYAERQRSQYFMSEINVRDQRIEAMMQGDLQEIDRAVGEARSRREQEMSSIAKQMEMAESEHRQRILDLHRDYETQRDLIAMNTEQMVRETQKNADRRRSAIESDLEKVNEKLSDCRRSLSQYEKSLSSIKESIEIERNSLSTLRDMSNHASVKLSSLKKDINVAEFESIMAESNVYNFKNPAEDSLVLSRKLDEVKYKYKNIIKDKKAASYRPGFSFGGDSKSGEKFCRDIAGIALSAYNAECENSMSKMRVGNLDVAVNRICKMKNKISKLGSMIELKINEEYHRLRILEIKLADEQLQAQKIAKELAREEREKQKEEKKIQAEIEAKRDMLRKEREHYENVASRMDSSDDIEQEQIAEKIAEIEEGIRDVEVRAANIRAGYVYVISNIGSFGEHMMKIGMTRRLEPMDRVRELGDASVPFSFDVHCIIFSEDAVSLESALHSHFANRRVNRINTRREFFYITPDEVRDVLSSGSIVGIPNAKMIEFTDEPEADQYRRSMEIISNESTQASVHVT